MDHSKTICIYSGNGTSKENIIQLESFLKSYYDFNIVLLTPENLERYLTDPLTKLLIIGGGRDIPYAYSLNGKLNKIIKEFVNSGGSYFGICAGAYYASDNFEFSCGTTDEIIAKRELKFFPGKTIGPIWGPYYYNSYKGARAVALSVEKSFCNINSTYVHYNGGGYFAMAEKYLNCQIIARFTETPHNLPAIIKINYGKGKVILSGPHIEYCTDFTKKFNSEQNMKLIKEHQQKNIYLLCNIIDDLI